MIKQILGICFILVLYYTFWNMSALFQQEHYNYKKYLRHIYNYYLKSLSTILMLIMVIPVILYNYTKNWYYSIFILFLILGVVNFIKPLLVKLKITKRMSRNFILYTLILVSLIISFKGDILVYNIALIITPLSVLLTNTFLIPIEKLIKNYYIKKALKKLKEINPQKIAVTGSFGKTSVKNFITSILDKKYITCATPKSYNTLMGLTKTINRDLSPFSEVFITEMGAFRKGEILELTNFINPNIAVITEIGSQHLETFKTIENIQDTKFEIVKSKNLECLVLNIDNPYIKDYENYLDNDKVFIIKTSLKEKNDTLYLEHTSGDLYDIFYLGKFLLSVKINLPAKYNLMNILESVAVGIYLKVDLNLIKEAVESLKPVPHRLSVNRDGNIKILDDAYNSNINGFKEALEVLKLEHGFRVIITPGIVDGGKALKELNISVVNNMIKSTDLILLIKNEASLIIEKSLTRNNCHKYLMFDSFKEAYAYLKMTYPTTKITLLIENDLPDSFLRR